MVWGSDGGDVVKKRDVVISAKMSVVLELKSTFLFLSRGLYRTSGVEGKRWDERAREGGGGGIDNFWIYVPLIKVAALAATCT